MTGASVHYNKPESWRELSVSHFVLHHSSLSANRSSLQQVEDGHSTALMVTLKRSAHIELKYLSLTSKFLGEGTWLTCLDPTLVQSPVAISQFFLPTQQSYLLFIFWVVSSFGLLFPSSWPLYFLSFRNISQMPVPLIAFFFVIHCSYGSIPFTSIQRNSVKRKWTWVTCLPSKHNHPIFPSYFFFPVFVTLLLI